MDATTVALDLAKSAMELGAVPEVSRIDGQRRDVGLECAEDNRHLGYLDGVRSDDGWAPRLQGRDELVWGYVGLAQDTRQRADLEFAVQGDDTAFGTATHDDVASGLAKLLKPQALQGPHDGSPRNVWQLRHAQER